MLLTVPCAIIFISDFDVLSCMYSILFVRAIIHMLIMLCAAVHTRDSVRVPPMCRCCDVAVSSTMSVLCSVLQGVGGGGAGGRVGFGVEVGDASAVLRLSRFNAAAGQEQVYVLWSMKLTILLCIRVCGC